MKTLSIFTVILLIAGSTVLGQSGFNFQKYNNSSATVPYKLLTFTGTKQSNNGAYSVLLAWSAVGETNIVGYAIEKSSSSSPQSWNIISYVPSSNQNLVITRNYSDNIGSIFNRITFNYRLKIYFTNHTIQYSNVVSVQLP